MFFSVISITAWYIIEKKRSSSFLASYIRGEITFDNPDLDVRTNVMRILVGLTKPFLPNEKAMKKWEMVLYRADIDNLKPEELYAIRWSLGVLMGILTSILFLPNVGEMLAAGLFSGLLWYLLPGSYVTGKAKARQKKAQTEVLPYTVMLEKVCRAGLDIKAGVRRVADKMSGVLSKEFDRAFDQTRRMRFSEAIDELRKRVDVKDVNLLVDALLQADQGANVVNILQDQTQRINKSTWERFAAEAQKAPLKMLLPLFLFIFPPLFVLMIGPIAMNMGTLFKM